MTQFKGYNIWIFQGHETTQAERDKRLILPDAWYVGDAPGADVLSGPHKSEGAARFTAEAMTDTGGT